MVFTIETDHNNHLWVGTSNGVFEINNRKVINHYSVQNGLTGNEINRMALKFDEKGRLWVGTSEGMTVIDLRYNTLDVVPPKPYIKSISSRSGPQNIKKQIQINHRNNDIEFTFGAYEYYNENSVQHKYKLEGFDEKWKCESGNTQVSARYNYLPHGQYAFVFMSRNAGGKWSAPYRSKLLIINKPFYLQYWFVILVLFFFFVLAFGLFNLISYHRNKVKLKRMLNEKLIQVNETQNDLMERNKELEKINEEQDTLVYSISHDLRGPILSTKGLINLYQKETIKSQQDHYVDLMNNSMDKLDTFIGNILDISRNSRLEVTNEPINIDKLVTQLIESHKYRKEALDIAFIIECEGTIIYSDIHRLTLIFNNLISNAIKYCNNDRNDKVIKVTCNQDKGITTISFYDNGIGIRKSYLETIFKIFTRATEYKAGSGLGLYIAKQSANRVNASLKVDSKYGEWTEFTLII